MNKSLKKMMTWLIIVAVVFTTVFSFVACKKEDPDAELYTYNTYTAVSPSNWNELTYQDENDRQIMSYIGSPFFEFDYKFDSEGNIVPGDFEVEYSAATKLEDVTADYAEEMGYAEGATGYAWKITLRNDLKWDDGTAIKAEDFVYTMKEQLNPLFRNYRADSYYNSGTVIHNAQGYAKQGLVVDETVSNLFSGIAAAKEAGYTDLYLDLNAVNAAFGEWFGGTYAQAKAAGYLDDYFTMYDENGESLGQNFFAGLQLEGRNKVGRGEVSRIGILFRMKKSLCFPLSKITFIPKLTLKT